MFGRMVDILAVRVVCFMIYIYTYMYILRFFFSCHRPACLIFFILLLNTRSLISWGTVIQPPSGEALLFYDQVHMNSNLNIHYQD